MTVEQFRGLSLRILVLAALALLPVLLLMAYQGWTQTGKKIAEERTRATHLAELLAREQTLPFTLSRQLLHSLAMMRFFGVPVDHAACQGKLKQAAAENRYVADIHFYSPDGELLCAASGTRMPPAADRAWFRQALAERRPVVSDYLEAADRGDGMIAMAMPVSDGQGVRAVLVLALDLGWIGHALATVPVAPETNIVLVDGAGTVLAPERWRGMSVAEHPVFKRISGITRPASFEAVGIDGVERIFVARPLNTDLGGRSYLWVAAPKSSASRAAFNNFLSGTLLVFVTVLAFMAAIWWEGSRVVLRPVRHLREAARQLSRSQWPARTNLPHSDDEIGQLAASFDEMAEQIEARELELEHSRESLLRANRTLRLLSAVKDVAGRATDEASLLDALCQTVARMSGCNLVFIARSGDELNHTPVIVAQEGVPAAWRERIFLPRDCTFMDPAGTVLRTGRACVLHAVSQDTGVTPWGELASELGIQAIASLPVRVEGRVWGILLLASTQRDTFDEEETRLLEELAADLGRGIETLRLRAEKQAAEDALRRMMLQLEQRVAERTAELEQVNRELEAFSYSISHDLRAPLRAIDGFAQALDEECGERLDTKCRDYLARIRGAHQRMSRLIDDMIELARISHSEMVLTEIDLSALATEIGAEQAAAEPSRVVKLTVAPDMTVRADPVLLRVLVQNLLENAWKYTAHTRQPEVEFGHTRLPSGEHAYFVRDNGAGFDMAFADRLFRPFGRLHRAEDYPGTGIGLATVARIASRHGGRVWGEGEKGRGATFHFVLG